MTTYRRVEVVKTTIRYEFKAPVDQKALGIGIAMVRREFEQRNGRVPDCDNDWWLEPMDEHIAIVFEVKTEREAPDV